MRDTSPFSPKLVLTRYFNTYQETQRTQRHIRLALSKKDEIRNTYKVGNNLKMLVTDMERGKNHSEN